MSVRTDEVAFRTTVPAAVNGYEVLEVVGYQAGERPGAYAFAYALTRDGVGYATHRLYCYDDRSEAVEWGLEAGRYGFETRQRATTSLISRAGWTYQI